MPRALAGAGTVSSGARSMGKTEKLRPKYHRAWAAGRPPIILHRAERPPMRPSTGASLYGERPVKSGAKRLTPNLAGFARRAA